METRFRFPSVPLGGTSADESPGTAAGWDALPPMLWAGAAAPSPRIEPERDGGAASPTDKRVGGNALHPEIGFTQFKSGFTQFESGFTQLGRRRRAGRDDGEAGNGFTLLEILLAIALMGLLAAVLVTGSVNLLNDKPATPEAVFWKAVQQSRATALSVERSVRLSFDAKTKTFVLDDGTTPQVLPVAAPPELTVDFLSGQAGASAVLIGGELVDTHTIPAVTFYPDGTCMPFRVQIRTTGAPRVLAIDPWTCAPVLPKVETSP